MLRAVRQELARIAFAWNPNSTSRRQAQSDGLLWRSCTRQTTDHLAILEFDLAEQEVEQFLVGVRLMTGLNTLMERWRLPNRRDFSRPCFPA